MPELEIHWLAIEAQFVLALITVLALVFISAPYGRHDRAGWGPTIASRTGWILMESPPVLVFLGVYLAGDHAWELTPLVLLGLWQFHYVRRAYIYPFRMRMDGKRMPLIIALIAIVFNSLNAYINARWISHFGTYADSWLLTLPFLVGTAVFFAGMGINMWADKVLRDLRKPGERGYKIPRGGLYDLISCPNYLGEILEWCGWAIATWSWAGLAFAVYTAANVGPRAFTNHAWYRETFDDYPPERKALIPYVA